MALVPISLFAAIALILFAFFYFRLRAKRTTQIRSGQAIDKGHELSPDLLARLGQVQNHKQVDLRTS